MPIPADVLARLHPANVALLTGCVEINDLAVLAERHLQHYDLITIPDVCFLCGEKPPVEAREWLVINRGVWFFIRPEDNAEITVVSLRAFCPAHRHLAEQYQP
jgi:hypothetical protein